MNLTALIAIPIILTILYITSTILWNRKYRPWRQTRGHTVDRFAGAFKRLTRFIFIEDNDPIIKKNTKNQPQQKDMTEMSEEEIEETKKAKPKKTFKFTWNVYYTLTLIATLATITFSTQNAWIPFLAFAAPLTTRAPGVLKGRHQALLKMLAVANSTFHYPRGAEQNPWAYINVEKWKGKTNPEKIVIQYPVSWMASNASKDTFETHFSQTITEDNTWVYKWETAKSTVTVEAVKNIPTQAPYPGSANRPWNEIPLGVGAGGEIVWDLKSQPHALVAGKSGSGKALSVNTQVTTSKGTVKIGDLQVGDEIFDEQGNSTTVTHLHPVIIPEKAYKIVFSDGEELIVDPDHLWYTETLSSRASGAQQRMKAKRGDVRADMMLFDEEEVANIQSIIDATTGDETISISEVAKLLGKSETSKYLYNIAKIVGPAEEVHPTQKLFYDAQVVKQKQNLLHYNAKEFIEVYNARPIRRTEDKPLKVSEIDKLRQLRLEVRDSDTLTVKSICEYLGASNSDIVRNWVANNYDGRDLGKLIEASENLERDILADQIFSFDKEYVNNYDFAAVMGLNAQQTRGSFAKIGSQIVDKFKRPTEVELIVAEKTVTRRGTSYFAYPKRMMLEQILSHAETPINDQRHKMIQGSVKTTQEIKDTLKVNGKLNHSIELVKPLQFPERDLPIAPYALGAWLGDGYSSNGDICGEDHEVKEELIKLGYTLIKENSQKDNVNEKFRIWTFENLKNQLREQGLLLKRNDSVGRNGSPKHIPALYLRASESQRRELLAGLMDTDGKVNKDKGTVSFTTVIPALRDGFLELVRSLGYQPFIQERFPTNTTTGLQGKLAYTVTFVADPVDDVFRIVRKREAHHGSYRGGNKVSVSGRRFVVDVVEVEPVPMRCISVDSPSRLFVVGEGLVATHNSVAQRNIVFHCIQHSDRLCFLGVDPKKVELKSYAKYTNTVLGVATTLEDMVEVLRYAKEEMMKRYTSMEALEVNHFEDLPEVPRAILVMVDEAYMLMSPENVKTDEGKENDALHGEASILIGEILRLGRAAGVHLTVAMQRPDAVVLKGEYKNNLEFRIAAGRLDSTASGMVLDSGLATRVPSNIKGRGVAMINGEGQIYQGYFAKQDWIDNWLLKNPEREPEVYEKLVQKLGSSKPALDGMTEDDVHAVLDAGAEFAGDDEVVSENEDEGLNSSRFDDSSDFLPENKGRVDDVVGKKDDVVPMKPADVDLLAYDDEDYSYSPPVVDDPVSDVVEPVVESVSDETVVDDPFFAEVQRTIRELELKEKRQVARDEVKSVPVVKPVVEPEPVVPVVEPEPVVRTGLPKKPLGGLPSRESFVLPKRDDDDEFGL